MAADRNRARAAAALAMLILAAGCASDPLGSGLGVGRSSGALFRRVEAAVLEADSRRAPWCGERRVVFTEVVREAGDLQPATGGSPETWLPAPVASHSAYLERWVVRRCGERARYLVTVRPEPGGDPEIGVVPEP